MEYAIQNKALEERNKLLLDALKGLYDDTRGVYDLVGCDSTDEAKRVIEICEGERDIDTTPPPS